MLKGKGRFGRKARRCCVSVGGRAVCPGIGAACKLREAGRLIEPETKQTTPCRVLKQASRSFGNENNEAQND